jgi:hypothetical protein
LLPIELAVLSAPFLILSKIDVEKTPFLKFKKHKAVLSALSEEQPYAFYVYVK